MPPPPPAAPSNRTNTIIADQETMRQLIPALLERYSLPISPTYLATFLSTTRSPLPPVPALISTLHFRLLASDITSSLSSSSSTNLLPPTITDAHIKERILSHLTPVQVIDILDVGTSRYHQLETLEMIERGETVKGREIIRTVDVDASATATAMAGNARTAVAAAAAAAGASTTAKGPFKLLLQDAKGTKVHAFTLSAIPKIGMPMPGDEGTGAMCIGCKLVLKEGTVIRRGVVMLKPSDVTVLGGKVDGWDKQWRQPEKRNKRLEQGMVAL